ncbi:MAG: tRNA (guanosine(37)-N1)-methyltransferase TrmD [Clostridia bacterium]|nr:tRNA (guanosine(37)-N1)-methyltransferase TrmD [Clostridia bacterium]
MKFDVMTLFPDLVAGVLGESILGRAQKNGILTVTCHNIRDYSEKKHKNVDDTPYGGGMGMVMAAPPICACYDAIAQSFAEGERTRVIYMSPKGRMLTQKVARELLEYDRLVILCGHYEGVDQRAVDRIVDEEISIGDYVLTGGELPACILIDSVARMLDGVLSSPECYEGESIASGLLEYPQYTRPVEFEGVPVPTVLLSGNHAEIDKWRLERSLELTRERRPELYEAYMLAYPPKEPRKKRK